MRSIELTDQQRYLHLVQFDPDIESPKATVVIAAALGVRQRFYQPFAKWLSEQGYRVITFDYYGIGQSLDKPIKAISSDLIDWAEKDIKAVLDYANNERQAEPLIYIAHSLGGQIVALADNAHLIDQMITVASGVGYWREASPQVKRSSWLLWYFAAPVAIPLAGYFPGKKLNMVGDMPGPAMKQWSRWCRSKGYLFDHLTEQQRARYRQFKAPITAFHISDDELLKKANIESLLSHYASSPQQLIELHPEMTEAPRIGHFNLFRSQFKTHLWQQQILPKLSS